MELHGKYTFIAEGVRGSLAKKLRAKFDLRAGVDPQKYGIGIKELWQVAGRSFQPGLVVHTQGWPLSETGSRRRLLHVPLRRQLRGHRLRGAPELQEPLALAVRRVPALQDPSRGRQVPAGRQAHRLRRARHHRGRPAVGAEAHLPGRRADRLLGGLRERAAHQGQPQRHEERHAGRRGRLRGAGRRARPAATNWSRIRRRSRLLGLEGAEHGPQRQADAAKCGTVLGTVYGGFDMWCTISASAFRDAAPQEGRPRMPAAGGQGYQPIVYPKPDGVLSLRQAVVGVPVEHQPRGGPAGAPASCATRRSRSRSTCRSMPSPRGSTARPASTRWSTPTTARPRFQINAQNCVHCKTCDIKDPSQNIDWTTPEGGGGPNYPNM